MDFRRLLNGSRRYTLHSHTEFCDGRATMDEFAKAAVAADFTHYGFTPHSPIPIASPCNMLKGHVDDYNREFQRITETYGDRCTFLKGMEIDYLGREWGPSHEYFSKLGLDYSIGSVHFIPSQDGQLIDIDGRYESFREKMNLYFRNDIRYVVEKFYESSIDMVDRGGLDIIGHLDKVGHNASYHQPGIEDEHWYQALVDDLITHVIDAGVAVEINTKAYLSHNHRLFPAVRYWPRLIAAGTTILVNSDAHEPHLIGSGRNEVYEIIDNQMINSPSNNR